MGKKCYRMSTLYIPSLWCAHGVFRYHFHRISVSIPKGSFTRLAFDACGCGRQLHWHIDANFLIFGTTPFRRNRMHQMQLMWIIPKWKSVSIGRSLIREVVLYLQDVPCSPPCPIDSPWVDRPTPCGGQRARWNPFPDVLSDLRRVTAFQSLARFCTFSICKTFTILTFANTYRVVEHFYSIVLIHFGYCQRSYLVITGPICQE